MDSKLLKALVRELAGKDALAWSLKKEGHLVVINARGEKQCFDAQTCQEHAKKIARAAEHDKSVKGFQESRKKGKNDDQTG